MADKKLSARSGHFHAVRFYEDAASLCRIVGDFVNEGLSTGQPAIVIATPAHQEGILKRLSQMKADVSGLQRRGDLTLLDATSTLAQFMTDGMPTHERFEAAMTQVIDKASRGRSDCTVRAYGEMVDLLWQAGMHAAAIRLEMLWNQLANTHRFSLLCGYSMGSFYKDAAYEEICSEHTHLVSAEGEAARVN